MSAREERIPRFDIWRGHAEAIASAKTGGIFNWQNVPFDWAGRWKERRPANLVADELIGAALDAVDVFAEYEEDGAGRIAAVNAA